jgi:2-methylisocitrate lyase-like PEP mutase family enzyme
VPTKLTWRCDVSVIAAGGRLRELARTEAPLVLPGVYDALSARLATAAGFRALYMSGYAVSASRAALPDDGLLTMSEMIEQAAAIVAASSLPVLADADAGYGDLASVARTVRRYEQVGVAGVHVEDVVQPKRGARVVSRRDMLRRIDAALSARADPAFVVVGRTDSYDTLGLDEAIVRARLLARAGVDVVFVHSLTRRSDFLRLREAVDAPLLMNVIDGITDVTSAEGARELGYALVIFSISALRLRIRSELGLYQTLAGSGQVGRLVSSLGSLDESERLLRRHVD